MTFLPYDPRELPETKVQALAFRVMNSVDDFIAAHPSGRLARWQTERFVAQVERRLPLVVVDGVHGTRYVVRPQDEVIGRTIIRQGAWELEKIDATLTLLHDSGIELDQLLDIGANIGTTTIQILRRLPEATGVAFEPDPFNFKLLRMNLAANDLDDRVTVHQAAVGDRSGSVLLELSDSNFGDHRVRPVDGGDTGALRDPNSPFREATRATITVPALRLDDIGGLEVGPRTLVFIDAQGFEGHVLAGARRLLEVRPPIAFELWPYGLDRAGGRQLLFAALKGYQRFFDISETPPRPLTHDDLAGVAEAVQSRQPFGDTDILALA